MNPFKKKAVCDLSNSLLFEKPAHHNSCCFFFCKKKQKLQCSGLTSKHSNSFVIIFIVWRQFFCFCFCFCFCETNFDVFTIFSELSGLKRKCTCHGNIYTNEKLNLFSDKICNFYVKKKEKKELFFNCLQEVIFSQISLVLSSNMYNCTCLREN